jgi:GT2 family glycosyltransferase
MTSLQKHGAPQPALSVIIVNWNHGAFLVDCLPALAEDLRSGSAGLGPVEVVVVDNGSADGSPAWIADHHPSVRVLRLPNNCGFSSALNYGIRNTSGALVLSLNPDVTVHPSFLQALVRGFEASSVSASRRLGMAAPKLLRSDDPALLDSTGLFVDRRRRPYDRGQGERDRGQYDQEAEVFGPCGAAALYRRAMLDDLSANGEPFDASFFAYCEDADLAWRAQLRGWSCVYVPGAVATHVRGWGDTLRRRGHAPKGALGPRLAFRNRYLMTVKSDAWRYVIRDLPLILGAELPRLLYAAFAAPAYLLAPLDLVRALPAALGKRRIIRSGRTVDDHTLQRWFVGPRQHHVRGRGTVPGP